MQFISGIKQAEQAGKSTARLDPAHHTLAVPSSSRDILSLLDSSGRDDASKKVGTCTVHRFVASHVASSSISFATEDDGRRRQFPALPWRSVRSTTSSSVRAGAGRRRPRSRM
jgi:hypothetical protein